jgi:hypothetical protein
MGSAVCDSLTRRKAGGFVGLAASICGGDYIKPLFSLLIDISLKNE